MKHSLIALTFLLLLVSFIPQSSANNLSGTFYLYLENNAAFGVAANNYSNITFTTSSGLLNSSTTTIYNNPQQIGWLQFNSSNAGTLTLSFSNLKVDVQGVTVQSGYEYTFAPNTRVYVQWWIPLTPLLPFMFIFGMIGLVCMFYGGLTVVDKGRKGQYMLAIRNGTVALAVGFSFVLAWLWT